MSMRDELIVSDTSQHSGPELDADTVRAIEAIVLVAIEPVPTETLAQLLEQPAAVIEQLCTGWPRPTTRRVTASSW